MSQNNQNNSSSSGGAARTQKSIQRKRRLSKKRVAVFLFIIMLMIAVVTVSVLMVHASVKPKDPSSGKQSALFGIKSVLITGNTHYTNDQILNTSGLFVGQSLFFVNKRTAAENILKNFPYVEKVTVNNTSFSEIKITIQEAEPVGIIKWDTGWLILGENGKGLEILSEDSSRIGDYRRISCEVLENGGVGCLTVNTRTQEIINTLVKSFSGTNLANVREMNLKSYTDIVLNWKDSIEIKMGSDVLLVDKLTFASTVLEKVLKEHGETAAGRIDMRSYTEAKQKGVFTPKDLMTDTASSTIGSGQNNTTSSNGN